jgi:iron complex outermembrane receptor protein
MYCQKWPHLLSSGEGGERRNAIVDHLSLGAALKGTLPVLLLISLASVARAQQAGGDLAAKSLEELMNVEVVSVSKKEEKLFQTAAAIYVITQEDIRRSGLTSIPELLRTVPGLSVARIDGNKWAISARGFNNRFAEKLLVLIDGRTVYSPLFALVYWDVQDLLLEDIERIEIIRGPGATMWGANAVNGVINIITKSARDTQGGLVTTGGGSEERGFGGLRYGGKIGDKAEYRFYTKYFNRSGLVDEAGRETNDQWNMRRGGLRLDWRPTGKDQFTLEGDVYHGDLHQTITSTSLLPPYSVTANDAGEAAGGNVLVRWSRATSPKSELAVRYYFDRTTRYEFLLGERRNTSDLDFQHRFQFGQRQDIVWGASHRYTSDDITNSTVSAFEPNDRGDHLFTGFVQDEVTLIKQRLRFTWGTKLEHNNYSGFEAQPSGRLIWTPHPRQTVWASVARAVKTPSRADSDVRFNFAAFPGLGGITYLARIYGNQQVRSAGLLAYELGYRVQPLSRLSLDIATFYNAYKHLRTVEVGQPFVEQTPPPHIVVPIFLRSLMHGETYGAEVAANWDVTHRWKVRGSYSLLNVYLHPEVPRVELGVANGDGESPQHQAQFHSLFNLRSNLEFDTSLYYVGRLHKQKIPGYTRADVRLGWRLTEQLQVSLGLQNLLDPRHPEFGSVLGEMPTQSKRGAYGKVTWRF